MELLSAAGPRLRGRGTPVGAALSGADDPAAVVGVPEVVDAEPESSVVDPDPDLVRPGAFAFDDPTVFLRMQPFCATKTS
jgi:hypothetical protein